MSEQPPRHPPATPPPPADDLVEAHELIMALLDGHIEPAQIDRLDHLACRDDRVLRLYSTYVHQQCVVAAIARPVGSSQGPSLDEAPTPAIASMDETMVVDAITSMEP